MNVLKSVTVLTVCFAVASARTSAIDKYLGGCQFETAAQLDQCFIDVLGRMRPSISTGIPELNLPSLEPLNLDKFGFVQRAGALNIEAKFTNVFVAGFTNYTLQDVNTNLKTRKVSLTVAIPEFRVTGNYDLNGNILLLPITGTGPFGARLYQIVATLSGNIVLKQENGIQRPGFANPVIDFQLQRIKVKLLNLFNGDRVLGDTVNHFINENGELILNEVRPAVSKDLSAYVGSIMDAVLSVMPVGNLFPEAVQ